MSRNGGSDSDGTRLGGLSGLNGGKRPRGRPRGSKFSPEERLERQREARRRYKKRHPDLVAKDNALYRVRHPERARESARRSERRFAQRRGQWRDKWLVPPRGLRGLVGRLARFDLRVAREPLRAEAVRDALLEHDVWLESLDG